MRDLRKNLIRGILSIVLCTMTQSAHAKTAGYEYRDDMLKDCYEKSSLEHGKRKLILFVIGASLLVSVGGVWMYRRGVIEDFVIKSTSGVLLSIFSLAAAVGSGRYLIFSPDGGDASCFGLFEAEINEHNNTITFWESSESSKNSKSSVTCLLSDKVVGEDVLKESSHKKHGSAADALEDLLTALPIQWETCTRTRKIL